MVEMVLRQILSAITCMIFLSVPTAEAQQTICGPCECFETLLLGNDVDFALCDSLGWIRLTDKPGDFLDTTVYITIIDTPIAELAANAADDYSGVQPNTLIDLIFINTEVRFIPNDYFTDEVFGNLEYVMFDDCFLDDLADVLKEVSKAPNVNELVLSSNPFPEITREMFLVNDLYTKLEGLNLGGNTFILPIDLFEDFNGEQLNALSLFDLELGADLDFLELLLIPVREQLQLLDLSGNELQMIPTWLKDFALLTELKLSDNAILTIEPVIDHPACLSIGDGYPAEGLFPASTLRLSLDGNQLETLDTRYLPRDLELVDISDNRISDLRYGFTEFEDLRTIDMSSNLLKAVLPELSNPTDNAQLLFVDVSRNRLSTLDESWLGTYEAVADTFNFFMNAGENPYSCYCGFAPILDLIIEGDLDDYVIDIQNITCYLPDGQDLRFVYNESINSADTSDLENYDLCNATDICDFYAINRYNCTHRHLARVPTDFPSTPWVVDLSHNNIAALTPSYLDNGIESSGILTLNLSYNVIGPSIAAADFQALEQLEELYLSHNKIETVNAWTFEENHYLRILDLSYNYIKSICHVGTSGKSLFYPLYLPETEVYLQHNQIDDLPCNAFSIATDNTEYALLADEPPENLTWHVLDLSSNCIDFGNGNSDEDKNDFYLSEDAPFPGAGVREITGRLDLSNNLITNFTGLMMRDLRSLSCVADLNIENNDVEKIGYIVIEQSLKTKWDECGSSLRLGDNPYLCDCEGLDFWKYYNQTLEFSPADLAFINFTSRMECASPSIFEGEIVYEIDYPYCACQPDDNPCFVYANNTAYFSECIENVYTDPPTASCGPCPEGFSGDGFTCTAISNCVDEPCFKDYLNPSLVSVCTDLVTDLFSCGACPSGMTGNGTGVQGCQDVDYCQLFSCYSDPYITLNCSDLAPPSTYIACDPCPEGLQSRINGIECNTDGQCCEDDNPCLDEVTNYCFQNETCVNNVWPQTGIRCGACPNGMRDLAPLTPGRYCAEIDGCEAGPCFNETITPATCQDVPWEQLEIGDDPFSVVCTCALGMTGIGVGIFGCYDIDGCVLEPCWEDIAGLGVEAGCDDVISYVNMIDQYEVNCTCPTGTVGDGLVACNDTEPCSGSNNPCYILNTCNIITPPLDDVTCGPCPAGYTGDGRTCTDIDECAEATACHPSLACVPIPAPYEGGDYYCLGECPCGMERVNAGKGLDGCQVIDLCAHKPCSSEDTCQFNFTAHPVVSCGACAPGTLPVPDCPNPGTKACCSSVAHFPLRINNEGVNDTFNMNNEEGSPRAGLLQVYYNGEWGDLVYPLFSDPEERQTLLTYTADAACRYLGYPIGYVLERELEVVSMSDPLLSLMCREGGDDIMHCDWSEFYTNSSDCSPDEDRHYIVCGTGVAGYQMFGYTADGPFDGEVYVTNYPLSGSCDSTLLPVCYIPGVDIQQIASSACINNGYSGAYKMIEGVLEPLVDVAIPFNGTCAEMRDGQVYKVRKTGDTLQTLHVECFEELPEYRLVGEGNFLQKRIGDYSLNDDGIYWGYLPIADYINLAVGFNTNHDWDEICKDLGFDHMITISRDVAPDDDSSDCRHWTYWGEGEEGFQLGNSCPDVEMLHLICTSSIVEVRVVDLLQRTSLEGRVEIKWEGLWSTLAVQDYTHVTSHLASVACRNAGYAGAVDWISDSTISNAELSSQYGGSLGNGRIKILGGDNFHCDGSENNLLDCENTWPASNETSDEVDMFYGRFRSVPTTTGYPLIVTCKEDELKLELSHYHYGGAVLYSEEKGLWEGVCVDFDPLCATDPLVSGGVPDSRLATTICRYLGYTAGFAIPSDEFDVELPDLVFGADCGKGSSLMDCEREHRLCNLTGGDHLLSVRCYEGYDACTDETNTCFYKDSCVDLPQGEFRLCSCPSGYDGDGYICNDIDECSELNNPCYDPASCVPVTAPSVLGTLPTESATCSPCPAGTEDGDLEHPGTICLEKNGCLPNECSRYDQCMDVTQNLLGTTGYSCGTCGEGYLPSMLSQCLSGARPPGSKECCLDADACAAEPCGVDVQCFDLPAPAPLIGGFTCGECPEGTDAIELTGRCQDIDYCDESITPCDGPAFCEDLPPPSRTARCQCHAGYLQNTTGVLGKCPEVNMCQAEPGICGVGRGCIDLPPPQDPSLLDTPATVCSECAPGYFTSFGFSITLPEYEEARMMGKTLGKDCVEYNACVELPLMGIFPCYQFPGNSAYDSVCTDVPAEEFVLGTLGYSCGPCPPGMEGNGYGQDGCRNIDACDPYPCDANAVSCTDDQPPLTGFTCNCPTGTIPREDNNVICQEFDACMRGNNACQFKDLCTDLPFTADRFYTCGCPSGMYKVSEFYCGDIDGCISQPCWKGCQDVPYTDPLVVLNPGTTGDDYICDPCPHGMEGSAVGIDGCQEINLCESAPLADELCFGDPNSGLSARCVDVSYRDLLPTQAKDLYLCQCPPGMTGDGYGPAGCRDIDYCQLDPCGDNTVCTDYPPPLTTYTCDCAAGYRKVSPNGACLEENHCTSGLMPCDPMMTCTDLPPPADHHSTYYPVARCSACRVGYLGDQAVVYLADGSLVNQATCTEIDGCRYNNTCWVNPITQVSDCQDVPASQLRPYNTGYEIVCGDCPHGMTGSGDTAGGQDGCTDVNGCEVNRCFVGVECFDIPWYALRPTQREDDYHCGECPGDLRGDGKSCFGACDFDTNLCQGTLGGMHDWYREVGLLDRRTDTNINQDPGIGEAPMFDHTRPLTTKGYYLTVPTYLVIEDMSSSFSLPVIHGPAAVHILFYAYYNGANDGILNVKQNLADGSERTLWVCSSDMGNEWVGVQDVYAWADQDFVISFEYYRLERTSLATPPSDPRVYVAYDDIVIDELDTRCTSNQLCYNADVCLSHPEEAAIGKGYTCYCSPGYIGQLCDIDIHACDSHPCQGASTCVPDRGEYTCVCPPTLTGHDCEFDVNECETYSVTCAYGGRCQNSYGDYSCDCPSGYTGKRCESNVDDCVDVDCGNGQCFDLVNDHTCICNDGWSGSTCTVNERQCGTSPCLHNALCTDDTGPFHCICPPGYTGRLCELNIDDCEGIYCRQGAECVDLLNDYQCDCPVGYGGRRCERDIAECDDNPCGGHGDCYEGIADPRCLCSELGCRDGLDCGYQPGRFLCDCYPGFSGSTCGTARDYCEEINPCRHGQCESVAESYECHCDRGWFGQNCEMEVDECQSEPCYNQGTCVDLLDGFACACRLGFTDSDCSVNINECTTNQCENGALCRDLVYGYECLCPENYVGEFCDLFVVEYITPNSSDTEQNSNPSTQAIIVPPQSSEDCRTFYQLSRALQYEIIGYTLLSLVLVILLLLGFAVCRIRGIYNEEGYDGPRNIVTRYVQNFPYYGGQYQPMPPPPPSSSGSSSSTSGGGRSHRSRRSRGSQHETHRYRFGSTHQHPPQTLQGYAPYYY